MILIEAGQLRNVWPLVEPWIAQAVQEAQGDETLLDVLIAVARGSYLLFYEPGIFAAVVHVLQYPAQKVAVVAYLGGSNLDSIRLGMEQGKAWCRENHINVIRTCGRPGWAKVVGLKRVGVILQETL